MKSPPFAALFLLALVPAGLAAQNTQNESTAGQAGRIASQPVRDVGVMKTKVPPLLERISDDPYSMAGASTCGGITSSIRALNNVLGPDFGDDAPVHGSRVGNVARAGGTALVDSIIPFRGLVREVSGAASAERRVQIATFAGVARRGFLRGIYRSRGCRTGL